MTPDEALHFSEEDEDPQKIFDRFDLRRRIGELQEYMRARYGRAAAAPGWYDRGGPQ